VAPLFTPLHAYISKFNNDNKILNFFGLVSSGLDLDSRENIHSVYACPLLMSMTMHSVKYPEWHHAVPNTIRSLVPVLSTGACSFIQQAWFVSCWFMHLGHCHCMQSNPCM